MNAEHEFLASAYLDGELTADERRIAEADPAVMAEVEQLRALRADLTAAEPASDAARESAIAAAMGAFHELHRAAGADAPAAAAPRVVPFRERFNTQRWLAVAAAAVAIGLLGVVVVNGLGGGTGGENDSADMAVEPAADEAADEPADDGGDAAADTARAGDTAQSESLGAAEATEAPAAADLADEQAGTFAEESDDAEAPEEAAADDVAAEETVLAAEDAESDGADDSVDEAIDAARLLDELPIRTRIELAAVGQYLLELIDRGEMPPTPEHSCPFANVLADTSFLDATAGEPDDEPIDVYIAVNSEFGTVLAIDRDTCTVLLRADLEP